MKRVVIYVRTSTEDQNPRLQLRDCTNYAKTLNLGDYEIIEEQISGWKDVERDGFNSVLKAIQKKEVNCIVCWDLDRLYRNRKKLVSFFELCKYCNCKIYSFRQNWLESINNIQAPFNEIFSSLVIQIMGWMAEDESNLKSMRVRLAVKKEEGKDTVSRYGKKWGKPLIKTNIRQQIIDMRTAGKSFMDIKREVYYWTRAGHKKFVSLGFIHKVLNEPKEQNNG